MTAAIEEHDVAMELLLCLGQGLWERLLDGGLRAYWMLLCDEISIGIGQKSVTAATSPGGGVGPPTSMLTSLPCWFGCHRRRPGNRNRWPL